MVRDLTDDELRFCGGVLAMLPDGLSSAQKLAALQDAWRDRDKDEPRRCPRCGSYVWVYKGSVQVCADCGK